MFSIRTFLFSFVSLFISLAHFNFCVEGFVVGDKITPRQINDRRTKETEKKNELKKTILFSSRTPKREKGQLIQPDNIFSTTPIWKDRDYVLVAARKMHNALASAPAFRGDREIVLIAVSNFGFAIQYVDPILMKDREIVMAAVNNHGDALSFVNGPLLADKQVVETAVRSWVGSIQFAAPTVRDDKDFNLELIGKYGPKMYEYLSEKLKNDQDVGLTCLSQEGILLKYAGEKIKEDDKCVKAAVSQNGYALQYAAEDLQKNRDIVTAAVRNEGQSLRFAYPALQIDPALKELRIKSLTARTNRWGNLYRLGNYDIDSQN